MLITFSCSLLLRLQLMYKIRRYNGNKRITRLHRNCGNCPFRWSWWTFDDSGMLIFFCMKQMTLTNCLGPETIIDFHCCLQSKRRTNVLIRRMVVSAFDVLGRFTSDHMPSRNYKGTDVIPKRTNACTCIAVHYTQCIPSTCFGHSHGHLQWGVLLRRYRNITKILNQFTDIKC